MVIILNHFISPDRQHLYQGLHYFIKRLKGQEQTQICWCSWSLFKVKESAWSPLCPWGPPPHTQGHLSHKNQQTCHPCCSLSLAEQTQHAALLFNQGRAHQTTLRLLHIHSPTHPASPGQPCPATHPPPPPPDPEQELYDQAWLCPVNEPALSSQWWPCQD